MWNVQHMAECQFGLVCNWLWKLKCDSECSVHGNQYHSFTPLRDPIVTCVHYTVGNCVTNTLQIFLYHVNQTLARLMLGGKQPFHVFEKDRTRVLFPYDAQTFQIEVSTRIIHPTPVSRIAERLTRKTRRNDFTVGYFGSGYLANVTRIYFAEIFQKDPLRVLIEIIGKNPFEPCKFKPHVKSTTT